MTGRKRMDLARKATRGAMWGLAQVVVRHVVFLGTTLVLVRLIAPRDFGLLDMVSILIELMVLVFQCGPSTLTVQKAELDEDESHGLFWVNVALGLGLALVTIVLSPLFRDFFGQEELIVILSVMGFGLFLRSLGVQASALLTRCFDTRGLFVASIGSECVASVIAIALAWQGWGWEALLLRRIVQVALEGLILLAVSGYRPRFPRKSLDWGRFLRFGGAVAFTAFLTTVGLGVGKICLGKMQGPEALAFFVRSFFLASLPLALVRGTIQRIALPALVQMRAHDGNWRDSYRLLVEVIALVAFPVATGLLVTAPVLVRVLYGERWMAVVPLVQAMSLFLFTGAFSELTGWCFVALDRVDRQIRLQLAFFLLHGLLVFCFSRWGVWEVSLVYGVNFLLLALVGQFYLHRSCELALAPTLTRTLRPLLASLAMGLGVWGIAGALLRAGCNRAETLIASVGSGVLLYGFFLWLLLGRRLKRYRQMLSAGRSEDALPSSTEA